MVSSRKRGHQEMESSEPPKEVGLLTRIRNTWEFANLVQWIFLFGKIVKLDSDRLDVEELEIECLKHHSTVLPEIGLALLKFISSHRGLTPEIFDEYTRRQYVAKAPLRNPYGTDEVPAKFSEFDVFTKLRVLQQLTQWTMTNPERFRERMEEQKDHDQTYWRIEPFGWDADERTYFVLDDDRLYRQTDLPPPPPPAPKPKKNSKKAKAALRASKRRKTSEPPLTDGEEPHGSEDEDNSPVVEDNGLGGSQWECISVTLDDLNEFLVSLKKSRDANEKTLRLRLSEELLPLLEQREESRRRKQAQKERELLNLEKLATAKRSSRIADKMEQVKKDEELKEAERKKQADLMMAKKEMEKWAKLERERESRMQTREQRLKEREAKRILHEEELANLSEDNKKLESGDTRLSERHLKAEIERKKQALEQLALEDDWVFDCICGAYGQVDDGSHSISCEECNIWQHTKCVGIKEEDADGDDFHFVCQTCKRRAARLAKEAKEAKKRAEEEERAAKRRVEEAEKAAKRRAEEEERLKNMPKITLKIKRPDSSSSSAAPTPIFGTFPASSPPMDMKNTLLPSRASTQQLSPPSTYSSPYVNGVGSPPHPQFQIPQYSAITQNFPGTDAGPSKPVSASFTSPYLPLNASSGVQGRPSSGNGPLYTNGQNSHMSTSKPTANFMRSPPPQSHQIYNHSVGVQQQVNIKSTPQPSGLGNGSQPYGQQGSQTTPAPRPIPPPQNGYHQSQEQSQRRSSMTFSSPMAGTPVLLPSPSYTLPQPTSVAPKQDAKSSPAPSPYHTVMNFSSPIVSTPQNFATKIDPSRDAALPPAATGISPTKHSPHFATTNGLPSLSSPTPSVLPPVAPLAPSPPQQNLAPPVKHDEPGLPHSSSSAAAPSLPAHDPTSASQQQAGL